MHGAQENLYFQRIRFDLSDLVVGASNTAVLERAIGDLAKRYDMQWRIFYDSKVPWAQDADVMMCTVSYSHVEDSLVMSSMLKTLCDAGYTAQEHTSGGSKTHLANNFSVPCGCVPSARYYQ